MSIFTVHLVQTSFSKAIMGIIRPPTPTGVEGLIHAEVMMGMTLGSPMWSAKRILPRQLVVFAQWRDEQAIDQFLSSHTLGRTLAGGWHVRMVYLRQWGDLDEFEIPANSEAIDDPRAPVVAVTLARMRMTQVPRFIRWGRPVEKQVRDDPHTTLALAATRLPRTVSTFSIWRTQTDMVKMVQGKAPVQRPERHAKAMKERDRKDFHFQFTTLRFKPLSEHGTWQGRTSFIPPFTAE